MTGLVADPSEIIAKARAQFPAAKETVCYNHAGISPLPLCALTAQQGFLADRAENGSRHYFAWTAAIADARALAAGLIGAAPGEVAFTGNTSMGLSLIAAGIDWKPGDRVVVSAPDFPSVLYPWLNLADRGVVVERLKRGEDGRIDLAGAAAALDRPARLLVVASVDYATGFAADLPALGALCRERGALFCLDAVQSLGALPLNARAAGAHFLASGTHKWLCGPMGLGILYVAAEAATLVRTPVAGWHSVVDEETFKQEFALKTEAARFEPGTLDVGAIMAFAASLSLLMDTGIETVRELIFAHQDALALELADRRLCVASSRAPGERSGIVCFEHPDAAGLFHHFMKNGVALSLRGGRIRLSPHFYADGSDIERFLRVLDAY